MESELSCPVCLDLFTDPIMLRCGHHICESHVEDLMKASSGEVLDCIVCREQTVVSAEVPLRVNSTLKNVVGHWKKMGGAEPQKCGMCDKNMATKACRQCGGNLCQTCVDETHNKGFFKEHQLTNITEGSEASGSVFGPLGVLLCDEHSDEKLSLYCLDCRHPVCAHCLLVGSHVDHRRVSLQNAVEQGQETLEQWNAHLVERQRIMSDFSEKLQRLDNDIVKSGAAHQAMIQREIDALFAQIEIKKSQLKTQSTHEEKKKRSRLAKQLDLHKEEQAIVDHLVRRTSNIKELESKYAFLALCLPLIQDVKVCVSQQVNPTPCVDDVFPVLHTDLQTRTISEMEFGEVKKPRRPVAYNPQPAAPKPAAGVPQTAARYAYPAQAHPVQSAHQGYSPQGMYTPSYYTVTRPEDAAYAVPHRN